MLLVNAQPLGPQSGFSLQLRSFFSGWPSHKLAQIYSTTSEPDTNVCRNNYRLQQDQNSSSQSLWKKYRFKVCGYQISKELAEWIRNFRPDAVFSELEDTHISKLVVDISKLFKIPVIPHICDDWIQFQSESIKALWGNRIRKYCFYWTLRKAPIRLVTSDSMAVEYRRRYGYEFFPFSYCIDPATYEPTQDARIGQSLVRFIYAGRPQGSRWQTLKHLLKAADEIAQLKKIELVIATDKGDIHEENELNRPWIRVVNYIKTEQEFADLLHSADIGVIAEGYNPSWVTYSRYSFSAKIPVYMMSGCCILGLGPRHLSTMRYIIENDCGIVISSTDPGVIRQELDHLLDLPGKIKQYGSRGKEVALRNHNIHTVQPSFMNLITDALARENR